MPTNLSAAGRADVVADAASRAQSYLRSGTNRRVFPDAAALAALANLPSELQDEAVDAREIVRMLDEFGSPATVLATQGRYFGFVNGGTDPAAAGAAILAGAWDQNAALPVMSPIAAHLDEIAARWTCELLGLAGATASFCSGATVANLTGVTVGRDTLLRRLGWDIARKGLQGAPRLRVVVGDEIHVSALKALHLAGFGDEQIERVPTDDCGRIRADAFPEIDNHTLVMVQAGNVNTGHSDPFPVLLPRVRAAGGWTHVDGAFGLWAAASPRRRHLVAEVELADSWATDAHKWLNAPYDAGIAICADGEALRHSMSADAAYLTADSDRASMHLGIQMSQRARGAETWAILASQGRNGLAAIIDRTCDRAADFARRLEAVGAELLSPVVLNQALVRFDDDATTDAVISAVQRDGECWAGATTWHGKRAMRLSVSDAATTSDDIARAATSITECWQRVRSGIPAE
jgi:glutamate/tyrosine decarboxylase-like PLP-dependent enzyme